MTLITELTDERLKPHECENEECCSEMLAIDSLRSALTECDALKEWKDGANVMITALNNRIKEVENQFTEYAHDSEIKRDALQHELDRTNRLWSEDRAAVRDWAAASDAIGELYRILGVTKDSAGFEDGFTKIVEATDTLLKRAEEAEGKVCRMREAIEWAVSIGDRGSDEVCCGYWLIDRCGEFLNHKIFFAELKRRAEKGGE